MIMSDAQPTTKTSTYRQSGWRETATGIVHIYYNGETPADQTGFTLIWDNIVTETSSSVPYVPPAPAS